MEEIGLFQLENLTISRSPFVFLDLRESRDEKLPPAIANCLQLAQPMNARDVKTHLEEQLKVPKEYPVLLVSQDGEVSQQTARDLEAAGFKNIYIIIGGVEGLVSEL